MRTGRPRNSYSPKAARRIQLETALRAMAPTDYTDEEWLAIIVRIVSLVATPPKFQELPRTKPDMESGNVIM